MRGSTVARKGLCEGKNAQISTHDLNQTALEHCSNLSTEKACNDDPYCTFVTSENDIQNVKANSVIIYDDAGGTDKLPGDNLDADFFTNGYSSYDSQKGAWYSSIDRMNKLCVPKKCEDLSAEACMQSAAAPNSVTSGKRHCTVSKAQSPTCAYTASDGCKCETA
jgi:hypothetical protein